MSLSLQGRVRSLYRRAWRLLRSEEDRSLVREAFQEHVNVPRKSFDRIEYLLRKGERQLRVLDSSRLVGVVTRSAGPTGPTGSTRSAGSTRPTRSRKELL